MLALAAAALSFTGPASLVSPSAVVARTDVQMNTKYTVAAGMAKKKGATGQSKSLWGYTVGSRAPDTAVSSGTTKSAQGLWEKLFSKPTEYKQTAGTSACRNVVRRRVIHVLSWPVTWQPVRPADGLLAPHTSRFQPGHAAALVCQHRRFGCPGMNTRDTGPKAKNKAQTGDSSQLKGYKVGMRDPNGYGARLAAKVWHVAPDGRWGCRPCPACAASPPRVCTAR